MRKHHGRPCSVGAHSVAVRHDKNPLTEITALRFTRTENFPKTVPTPWRAAWNFPAWRRTAPNGKIAESRVRRGPEKEAIRRCGLRASGRNARTRFDRVSARKAQECTLHKFTRHPHNAAKETERELARETLYNSSLSDVSRNFLRSWMREREREGFLVPSSGVSTGKSATSFMRYIYYIRKIQSCI